MTRLTQYYSGGDDELSRPDFVLVGMPARDGVELWASTELTEAELKAEITFRSYEVEELLDRGGHPGPASTAYTLRAGLRKFVIVRAVTYREALAALLEHPGWGSDGRRMIGGG